jgi:hypothetical protein
MKSGGIWSVMRPGQFIMEHGMMLGIKARAERLAESETALPAGEITPTPEVFIPRDKAIPDAGISLEGVRLDLAGAELGRAFPVGCNGEEPACIQAKDGFNFIGVAFAPRDLPEGQMLAYKQLPSVRVNMEGGVSVAYSLTRYNNTTHTLTLGFEVPESAVVFGLQWADLAEVPLEVVAR